MPKHQFLKMINYTCAAIVAAVAISVMLGWAGHSHLLVQLPPSPVPMAFNTALCFLLCAASLALIEAGHRRLAFASAGLTTSLALLTLLQYVTRRSFGIDTLFVTPFTTASAYPGRMAINTAISLSLCGMVLVFCAANQKPGAIRALCIAAAGSTVGAVGLIALAGILAGISIETLWGKYTQTAMHSAVCLTILGGTLIVLARERSVGFPLWLPIPVFLGFAAVTLTIGEAVRIEAQRKLADAVAAEVEYSVQIVERHLADLSHTLERFGQRWEAQGGIPRPLWERNAASIARDFPALRALLWADAANRVQWVVSAEPAEWQDFDFTANSEVSQTLSAVLRARDARISPVIMDDPAVARGALLHLKPLFADDRYQGMMVAVIDTARLFHNLLADTTLKRLSIAVDDGGRTVFANMSHAASVTDNHPHIGVITAGDRTWLVKAHPTSVLMAAFGAPKLAAIFLVGFTVASLTALCVFLLLKREGDHAALRLSEERLALAVAGTLDAVWDWNVLTDQIYSSPRLRAMLGGDGQQSAVTAAAFIEQVHPDDRESLIAAAQAHFTERAPFDVSFRMPHCNGHYIWLNMRGQAVWDEKGNAVRMTGFISDISHEKEVERLKNEFVSTVSHELRTPLTSIRGALALISSGVLGVLPARIQEMTNIAHKNCERLILLINDILDLDKIESGQTRFDVAEHRLTELLSEAVAANRSFAAKDGIHVVLEPMEAEAIVRIDANRLNQVLNNLISNAAKFSPADEAVTVRAEQRGGKVRVSVIDRGPGIPPQFQDKIFQKFAQADSSPTRRQAGTGLGLHISQQIIRRLGGEIGFETEAGKGTTFWFELANVAPKAPPANVAVVKAHPAQHGPVLICEDDADAARVLQAVLEEEGFASIIAHNLAEAKKCLAETPVQALILDLLLPDGNGIDLIRAIRASESGSSLPIVVTSIRAEEEKAALNGGAIGIVDWLHKEVDPARLIEALRRCISQSAARPLRILHAERDADFREVISQMLSQKATIVGAATVEEGLRHLATDCFDLMILDPVLPDGSGLTLLERLGSFQLKLPVLILSELEAGDQLQERVAAALVKSRVSERKIAEMIAKLVNDAGQKVREAA